MHKRLFTLVTLLMAALLLGPSLAQARYYDPKTGQFVSADPEFDYPGNLGNPYSYAGGNPVNGADPTGRFTSIEMSVANCISSALNHMNLDASISGVEQAAAIQGFSADASMAWDVAFRLRQAQFASDMVGYVSLAHLGAEALSYSAERLARFGEMLSTRAGRASIGQARRVAQIENAAARWQLSLQTLGRGPDSTILGKNLEAVGHVRPPNTAAHHIVPSGLSRFPAAKDARDVLIREGIDINEASNGVFLPANRKVPNPPAEIHAPLHTEVYVVELARRLSDAEPGTVRYVLEDIRRELLDGTFPR